MSRDKKGARAGPAAAVSPAPDPLLDKLPAWLLGATLLLAPLFPDEKLNRLKLMALGIGLIAAGLARAAALAARKEWVFYRTPLDPYLLAYVLLAALYSFFSRNPAVASSEFQRMVFSVGAYLAATQACSGPRSADFKRAVLRGWVAGLALVSIYGILQRSGGAGPVVVPQMDRVFATFGNPIFLAAYLVASLPILWAKLLGSRGWAGRALWLALIGTSSVALLFTETRAAFLACPISLAAGAVLLDWRGNWKWLGWLRSRMGRIAWPAAALAGLHLLAFLASPAYRDRLDRVRDYLYASRMTATSQTHTLIWKDVLKMWRAHPMFGTGFGTFHVEFPPYASEELRAVFPERQKIINDAHNEYLQILAETGLAGFTVFMALLAAFFFTSVRGFLGRRTSSPAGPAAPEPDPDPTDAGLIAGAAALLIQNFFSVDMRFIVSSAFLFLLMGLSSARLSRPVSRHWGPRNGRYWKILWIGSCLAVTGMAGIGRGGFYVLGIYRYGPAGGGSWEWEKTPAQGPGLLPSLLRPYLSQKVLDRTPDFFDEKILNSAQTIRDLEALTRQFPGQWKTWEKLGWALAKEIQVKSPDGGKANDRAMAERAVAAYLKAHELAPQADGPPNNIGNIFYTLNQPDQAIAWWEKAIRTNPDKIDARLNLGLAYYFQGKIRQSAAQFEEVLKREPHNEKAIVMLKRMVE